jgi:hypothetical protein
LDGGELGRPGGERGVAKDPTGKAAILAASGETFETIEEQRAAA